jgi:hypothetical protein
VKKNRFSLLCATLGLVGSALASGGFVVPSFRTVGGEFAYWNLFQSPLGSSYNYQYNNPPALLNNGRDSRGNVTNLMGAALVQHGTPTCFVTSSGALYSFAAPTAFKTNYLAGSAASPTVNVVFQVQTGGRRFDVDNIRLVFTPPGGEPTRLAPNFKALDDAQTGAFSERLVSAFQWDLTGQGVENFSVEFSAPGDSMPLWEAQLDVVKGSFQRALGYLLLPRALPIARFSNVGSIFKNLPASTERRFHNPGDQVPLVGVPASGWAHTGWLTAAGPVNSETLTVTFDSVDLTATALFAPETYAAWRDKIFRHANSLTNTPAENTIASFSGKAADPDGDGASNFQEFAFGGDPYTPDLPRMTAECLVVRVDGVDYPAMRYREGSAGFTELFYQPRWSEDLLVWQDNLTAAQPVTATYLRELQPDGTTLVTERSLRPLSAGGRQYFQARAE